MAEEDTGEVAEAEVQELSLDEGISDEAIDNLPYEDVESLLDESINGPQEEESVEESASKEKSAEEKPAEEKSAKEEEPAKEEVPAEEEKSAKAEEKPEEKKPAAEEESTPESRIDKLEAENQELLAKLNRQGTMIGRWSNEVGEMRRLHKVSDKPRISDEEFAVKMEQDPRGAIREEQQNLRDEADGVRADKARLRNENEDYIRQQLPDFDDLLPEMVKVAKERYGLEDWAVKEIEADPFTFDSREILDIARDVKLKNLEAKLSAAETETPKPKEKANGSKEDLADKINKAAKKTPRLSGGSGQGADDSAPGDLEDLSDAQIEAMDEKTVTKILKGRGVPV